MAGITQLYPDRPRPLMDAAARLSQVIGILGSLTTGLVGFGILTIVQGDAVTGLLGTLPGVVTAVASVLSAFGVVRAGEPQVTPLSDPRDDAMIPLRPAA